MKIAQKCNRIKNQPTKEPRQSCQQRHCHNHNSRNCTEGLVLKRSQCLKQADTKAGDRSQHEHRRTDNQGLFQEMPHKIHYLVRSAQKLLNKEPDSRFHPSTITKSKILSGVETTTGGN